MHVPHAFVHANRPVARIDGDVTILRLCQIPLSNHIDARAITNEQFVPAGNESSELDLHVCWQHPLRPAPVYEYPHVLSRSTTSSLDQGSGEQGTKTPHRVAGENQEDFVKRIPTTGGWHSLKAKESLPKPGRSLMRGRKEDNHLLLRPHPFMKVISPNSVPTKPWGARTCIGTPS